jgi:hypothetical protein
MKRKDKGKIMLILFIHLHISVLQETATPHGKTVTLGTVEQTHSFPLYASFPFRKVKVKSLCLTEYHAVKTYWGVDVQLHVLTSALNRGEWSASHSGRFTPEEKPLVRRRVGPRAGLDAVVKRKNPRTCRKSNPGLPARSLVTYTDWAIPDPSKSSNTKICDPSKN